MKRILITGGCGFIGSNLAVHLVKEGYQVTCFDNLSRRGSEILLERILEHGCSFVHGDIRSAEDFGKLGDFDYMIECSAEPSVLVGSKGDDAMGMISNNLTGSVNCFEFCRKKNIPVIFLSTSRVYPYDKINALHFSEQATRFEFDDTVPGVSSQGISADFNLRGYRSLYGATKLASEYILQEYAYNYNLPAIINRCGVIAGPWQLGKVDQGVFTFWLVNHYYRKNLKYIGFGGKGKQVRDLLHIDDLCGLVSKQLQQISRYRGNIFNAGGSLFSSLSLLETTALCQKITGNEVPVDNSSEERPADLIWYLTDNGDTLQEFGWKPTSSPEKILNDIYLWLHANDTQFKKLFTR